MCGIAVILPSRDLAVPPGAIERMTLALRHRGPDGQASVRLPGCHLGHTRLSVIDPAGGTQPMTDDAGRFTVVFNGEIYNYRELRRDLERAGVAFRTRSDTEVLLLAYRHYGPAVLSRLNGQFAFAIWDAAERKLFAARDRFGEKPLFWAQSPQGHLLLASEIKSILAAGLLSPRIDPVSVDAYLGLYYVPPGRTIYENVHPLPPAHAAEFTETGVRTWRYWQPALSANEDITEAEAVAEVRTKLATAVNRQMVADVPVGAFLSGGLDSSTIVALMNGRGAGSPRTFSAGFGDLIDELPYARDVADLHRTDHHELQMDIDVAAMLHRMADVYDEPFGDSSNIPTYLVAKYARRHVKVVLCGDGGDEIFGGYSWYAPLLDSPDSGLSADGDWWARHVGGATGLLADRSNLWGPGRQPPAAEVLRQRYRPGHELRGMDRASHFDLECYLPGDILTKVDRAAMAHGLETRCPFLDAELVEFVLGLPWWLRFARRDGGGAPYTLKHLLHAACQDLWPVSVRGRGKQGFGAPVRHWLQVPAVAELWGRVTRRDGPLAALLPGVGDAAVLDSLRPQRRWALLCLGLWLEGQGRSECLPPRNRSSPS